MYLITWITTHLPTPERWMAELAKARSMQPYIILYKTTLQLGARTTGTFTYLIIPQAAVRTTCYSVLPLLTLPTTHTNFAGRAFTYCAPHVWNNLPPNVLHCNTLNTFKKHLKTHLFTSSLTSPNWSVTKRLWSSALRRYINVCIIIIIFFLMPTNTKPVGVNIKEKC